eukprot:gene458-579_t
MSKRLIPSSPFLQITNNYTWLKKSDPLLLKALGSRLKFPRPINSNLIRLISAKKGKPVYFESEVSFFNAKSGKFGTGLLPIVESHLSDLKVDYKRIDHRNPLPQLYNNWDYTLSTPKTTDSNKKTTKKRIGKVKKDDDNQDILVENKEEEEDIKLIGDQEIRVFDLQPSDLQPKTIDSKLFSESGVTLHDFQVDTVNFALANHRGIIKCATGGGKTLILAAFLKAIGTGVPTVILVTKRTLITQIYNVLVSMKVCEPGRVSSDFFQVNTVTISTIQSVKKIEDFCRNAKVLLVDEVHQFTTPFAKKAFDFFENAYSRFGFSATPFKLDDPVHNHTISSVFGTLLCDLTTKDLTDRNILSGAHVHFYPINYPSLKKSEKGKYHEMEHIAISDNNYFNLCIAKLVESIPKGRIMILVKRLSHGEQLSKLIPNSYWIKGEDSIETREHVIKQLCTSTDEKVVGIFSSIGNVGLDVKVHHLINASGGKDPNLTIQKLGRGLRKADDKQFLDYHDFYFEKSVDINLEAHSSNRVHILQREGHPIRMEQEIIDSKPFHQILEQDRKAKRYEKRKKTLQEKKLKQQQEEAQKNEML